jgi:hypothetical protein
MGLSDLLKVLAGLTPDERAAALTLLNDSPSG